MRRNPGSCGALTGSAPLSQHRPVMAALTLPPVGASNSLRHWAVASLRGSTHGRRTGAKVGRSNHTHDAQGRAVSGSARGEAVVPEVATVLAEDPDRVSLARRLTLLAVARFVAVGNGPVGVVVEMRNGAEKFRDDLVFVRAGDRWLIDEQVTLVDPIAAMPTR